VRGRPAEAISSQLDPSGHGRAEPLREIRRRFNVPAAAQAHDRSKPDLWPELA